MFIYKFSKMKLHLFFLLTFCAFSFHSIAASCSREHNKDDTQDGTLLTSKPDLIVAADGSGDYKTVQEAINASPDNRTSFFYIYIKKGIYKEVITIPRTKEHLYLIGEDANNTILTFDNYASKLNERGKEYGTSGSASFFAHGDFFVAENLTFENTSGINAGQALAINIGAAKSSFRNCRFLGHQDTWYAGNGTVQYLKNCYIEGSVDFIFGGSTAFFDECHIHSTRNGYITAASTPENQPYGYIFHKCKFTALNTVADGSVYLGRPWRPHARVLYLESQLGKHIHPAGWHNWGKTENEKTVYYAEYKSSGEGVAAESRVSWSKQLAADQAQNFTYDKVIGYQHPEFNDDMNK